MNGALGLIEIKGLAGAINVADAMVKTANVELLGIEKAKGFGWITIKITGEVSAVTASVQTGRAIAEQNGQLVSFKVIPRPAQSIGELFCGSPDPVPHPPKNTPKPAPEGQNAIEPQAQSASLSEPESVQVLELESVPEQVEPLSEPNQSFSIDAPEIPQAESLPDSLSPKTEAQEQEIPAGDIVTESMEQNQQPPVLLEEQSSESSVKKSRGRSPGRPPKKKKKPPVSDFEGSGEDRR